MRALVTDGFGNLVTVVEPNPAGGTFTTSYTCNSFNPLTSVTQPETGTTTYGYDSTGKLSWRRVAKQQKTEYSYDVYNRPTIMRRYRQVSGVDVEDPTQKTEYSYDAAPNGWGRLGSISTYQNFADLNSTGTMPIVESFEYTAAGLVSKKTLNVTGVSAVSVSYEWDNEGRPVVQKFPDMATGNPTFDTGPRFTWGYDAMGRLSTMGQTEPLGGFASTLVSSTAYNAAGQMTELVRPGGTESRTYNVLGQLTKQEGLGRTVEYSYNATANDGRITKRKELSGEEVDYLYDSLGRLISAATTGPEWGLSFSYDGFGNKTQQTVTKGTGPSHSYAVDAATNRLGGFGHDANGNVISGLAGLAGTYSYDVENRMVDNGVERYGYGAGNRRLWRSTGTGTANVYLYGLGGELLEVFLGSVGSPLERQVYTPTQRAWFGGRLLEKKGTSMNADRLGSYQGTYPYGELQGAVGMPGEKFATYWRDATGLDYAVNRYYSSQMGRFLSADPSNPSDPGRPTSWNLNAYVEGDPINSNDPEGLNVQHLNLTAGPTTCYSERFSKQISSDLDKWLNSDVGTMAPQVWFEFSSAAASQYSEHMWLSLANVYRNRWLLTPTQKQLYGFDRNADFKHIIYASAGHGWWNPKTPADKQSHWNENGSLKTSHVNDLVRVLNSKPDSSECAALIDSFQISTSVYQGHAPDPTEGATFYVHYWYPRVPWGGSQPNLSNPFGFRTSPFLTYVTPFTPYTTIGGQTYYVSAWFYKPAN